jgi:hypothetical protein
MKAKSLVREVDSTTEAEMEEAIVDIGVIELWFRD